MTRTETQRSAFAALVALEPELRRLLEEIRAGDASAPSYCANAAWYGYRTAGHGFKGQLVRLVGWERRRPPHELRTHEAYDCAYQTCYDALPNCRHEGGC